MIFAVYNGWMGNGPVAVLLDAPDRDTAITLAGSVFHSRKPDDPTWWDRSRMDAVALELPAVVEIEEKV